MKKAVIVVGTHHAGKSKTINKYFKGKIGLSEKERKFSVGDNKGHILSQSLEEKYGIINSQSLEEKGLVEVTTTVEKYKNYEQLIFAARPENEKLSYYKDLKKQLEKRGFVVETVKIIRDQKESYYKEKAEEIYKKLV